jgi:hypothetical protein
LRQRRGEGREEKIAQESRNAGIQERKRQKEYEHKEKRAEDGPLLLGLLPFSAVLPVLSFSWFPGFLRGSSSSASRGKPPPAGAAPSDA